MAPLKDFPVTVCGAVALEANITENLARSGFSKLVVIDRDRIEERNLFTQPYYKSDIGAYVSFRVHCASKGVYFVKTVTWFLIC